MRPRRRGWSPTPSPRVGFFGGGDGGLASLTALPPFPPLPPPAPVSGNPARWGMFAPVTPVIMPASMPPTPPPLISEPTMPPKPADNDFPAEAVEDAGAVDVDGTTVDGCMPRKWKPSREPTIKNPRFTHGLGAPRFQMLRYICSSDWS